MSAETFPKLNELQSAVKAAIDGIAALKPGENKKRVLVIVDDGLQKDRIENQLKTKGFVIVVAPLLEGKVRDQSGPAWLVDIELMVAVISNPERNSATDTGGVGLNMYSIVSDVIDAVCRQVRHPGGEFFKLLGFALSKFDESRWVYDLSFTKENFEL